MENHDQNNRGSNSDALDAIAAGLFETLARRFPVCMSSDEFHYYPQATVTNKDWSAWDNFSDDAVAVISEKLRIFKRKLQQLNADELTTDRQVDCTLLKRIIITLLEQFNDVKSHKAQPAFYLSMIGVGLAEAIDAGSRELSDRLKGLPVFLRQAEQNLKKVHDIYRDQGRDMANRLRSWIGSLPVGQAIQATAVKALEQFHSHLNNISGCTDFLVSVDLYERIVFQHMGCFMPVNEIKQRINHEINETAALVEKYATGLSPEISWEKNIAGNDFLLPQKVSEKQAYRKCISDLADHCIKKRMVSSELVKKCPVYVETVPDYMAPVRSNAAYSMSPGYPPKGGVFFIMESGGTQSMALDYKFLTAHETYPGHHLLDNSRWNLKHVIRRHMEFPLFYEGWACIAEELLIDTGFFSQAFDRMLSAKRRLWRALRGKTDLDIHMRRKSLAEAAAFLCKYGMADNAARALVQKYIQKPGYQIAYAVGRTRFKEVYDSFIRQGGSPESFTRRVLSYGEVGFDHLSQYLKTGGKS